MATRRRFRIPAWEQPCVPRSGSRRTAASPRPSRAPPVPPAGRRRPRGTKPSARSTTSLEVDQCARGHQHGCGGRPDPAADRAVRRRVREDRLVGSRPGALRVVGGSSPRRWQPLQGRPESTSSPASSRLSGRVVERPQQHDRDVNIGCTTVVKVTNKERQASVLTPASSARCRRHRPNTPGTVPESPRPGSQSRVRSRRYLDSRS